MLTLWRVPAQGAELESEPEGDRVASGRKPGAVRAGSRASQTGMRGAGRGGAGRSARLRTLKDSGVSFFFCSFACLLVVPRGKWWRPSPLRLGLAVIQAAGNLCGKSVMDDVKTRIVFSASQ